MKGISFQASFIFKQTRCDESCDLRRTFRFFWLVCIKERKPSSWPGSFGDALLRLILSFPGTTVIEMAIEVVEREIFTLCPARRLIVAYMRLLNSSPWRPIFPGRAVALKEKPAVTLVSVLLTYCRIHYRILVLPDGRVPSVFNALDEEFTVCQ